jgi:hypothetical protein
MFAVYVVELLVTIDNIKTLSFAQKCFMANLCGRQQQNVFRSLGKVGLPDIFNQNWSFSTDFS